MNFVAPPSTNAFGQTSSFGSIPSNIVIVDSTNTSLFSQPQSNTFGSFGSTQTAQNQTQSLFNTNPTSTTPSTGGLFGNQTTSMFSSQTTTPNTGWGNPSGSVSLNQGMGGFSTNFQTQQTPMSTQLVVQPKVLESSQEFENTLKNYINIFK